MERATWIPFGARATASQSNSVNARSVSPREAPKSYAVVAIDSFLSASVCRQHKEFEEECKNEALRREAQLAAGYNYVSQSWSR